MIKLTIAELPSPIWDLRPTFSLRIDRSNVTVADYLKTCGVTWLFGSSSQADIELSKEETGFFSPRHFMKGMKRHILSKRAHVSLIGEPRELASGAYLLARGANTLAVAPGQNLRRLYFASEWIDPQLEGWNRRQDRFCWIARPTHERIIIARKLITDGIPLDIYSKEPWPLPEWKGYAENEVKTSLSYRYRIVCENSSRYGYHSEKLFNSIRCGCVTFYQGDPSLDLSHVEGAFLPLELWAVKQRNELSDGLLEGIESFMFSDAWEIYSFRSFYDRILGISLDQLNR